MKLPGVEHNPSIREEAILLLRRGMTNRDVAEHFGIPRGTIGWWRHQDRKCRGETYLGDGHIISKPVDAHPWEFIRGLIHSDGCRVTNWTVRNGKRYEYPRYFFTNKSDDITGLLTRTLDRVGVQWKQANKRNVSIARKASVALMDVHVGPKY